jgi:hypothetical protein
MSNRVQDSLFEIVQVYTTTKRLVLRAEELDEENRSNISVFKEQRDALDHLMRALSKYLEPADNGESDEYIRLQIDKAKGHLFRASYDSVDGISVSAKFKIKQVLEGIDTETISQVLPEYWTEFLPLIDEISEKIALHREKKDIGDLTAKNLHAYIADAEKLSEIHRKILRRRGALEDYQKRIRFRRLKDKLFWPLTIGVILLLLRVFVFG